MNSAISVIYSNGDSVPVSNNDVPARLTSIMLRLTPYSIVRVANQLVVIL